MSSFGLGMFVTVHFSVQVLSYNTQLGMSLLSTHVRDVEQLITGYQIRKISELLYLFCKYLCRIFDQPLQHYFMAPYFNFSLTFNFSF